MFFTILYNMPGCLPEMEPYVVEADDLAGALDTVRDEVVRMADEDATLNTETGRADEGWDEVIAQIDSVRQGSDDGQRFSWRTEPDGTPVTAVADPGTFALPNGYVIEASPKSESELREMGYGDELDELANRTEINRRAEAIIRISEVETSLMHTRTFLAQTKDADLADVERRLDQVSRELARARRAVRDARDEDRAKADGS